MKTFLNVIIGLLLSANIVFAVGLYEYISNDNINVIKQVIGNN